MCSGEKKQWDLHKGNKLLVEVLTFKILDPTFFWLRRGWFLFSRSLYPQWMDRSLGYHYTVRDAEGGVRGDLAARSYSCRQGEDMNPTVSIVPDLPAAPGVLRFCSLASQFSQTSFWSSLCLGCCRFASFFLLASYMENIRIWRKYP